MNEKENTWNKLPTNFFKMSKENRDIFFKMNNIDKVKYLIKEEILHFEKPFHEKYLKGDIEVSCYLSNNNEIKFQFLGWAIWLKEDRTWFWEDTSGG